MKGRAPGRSQAGPHPLGGSADVPVGRGVVSEAERQRRLMSQLLAARADATGLPTRESGARALRGLQAYRANADASAARALGTAFPTVHALVGDEDFEHLAREFWRAAPPQRGDLGEWGADFAAWLSEHPQLADWPYLGDCARLDWATTNSATNAPHNSARRRRLRPLGM